MASVVGLRPDIGLRNEESGRVRKYRLFCLNPNNGHMETVSAFQAADDDHAVQLVEFLRDNRTAELWRTYRVIKRWEAD